MCVCACVMCVRIGRKLQNFWGGGGGGGGLPIPLRKSLTSQSAKNILFTFSFWYGMMCEWS